MKRIYHCAVEGNALKAIELTKQLANDLLEKNKDLHFDLLSLHFVELVCSRNKGSTDQHAVNPFKLIGLGLSIWTFVVTGCGFSFNFLSILICHMLVGVGEASFISLAAPFIDDNAPALREHDRLFILMIESRLRFLWKK
ncbi:uncharacterized protein LOC133734185 [Rosa rugosa]|uniref:uncharacterized protein LOC133734185 n=1 Tax=Rosa rugosa TaxID=74645 RepID=UPI002B412260|nr:uncharacterized protein LOC133734185 [Rosa rugosa]